MELNIMLSVPFTDAGIRFIRLLLGERPKIGRVTSDCYRVKTNVETFYLTTESDPGFDCDAVLILQPSEVDVRQLRLQRERETLSGTYHELTSTPFPTIRELLNGGTQ